jgi:hypothetical protein
MLCYHAECEIVGYNEGIAKRTGPIVPCNGTVSFPFLNAGSIHLIVLGTPNNPPALLAVIPSLFLSSIFGHK